tara:strand:+ start:70997 stop:71191 length:195 start_codon:yes stop_codon:yes gene_type:complete
LHGESNSQTGNRWDQLLLIERFDGVVSASRGQAFFPIAFYRIGGWRDGRQFAVSALQFRGGSQA